MCSFGAEEMAAKIKIWGKELGFVHIGITDSTFTVIPASSAVIPASSTVIPASSTVIPAKAGINSSQTSTAFQTTKEAQRLTRWLESGFCGDMDFMRRYEEQRGNPNSLFSGVKSIISCALNYYSGTDSAAILHQPNKAYIARYALGRDYHKIMRGYLQKLAQKMQNEFGVFNYRCFTDSAPVLEKPLAVKAGIGWQGKNSLVISPKYGSWIVLGEIFTDLPLSIDKPEEDQCGNCATCIKACPTKAIVAPYTIDARRCIAYLTIEHKGLISEEVRHLMGNKIYGCDVCQLVCPKNKQAKSTTVADFFPRNNLDQAELLDLFNWSETEFLEKTAGTAIKRIGYERWRRNLAIALENAAKRQVIKSQKLS
jgi:epoxyqueuosine reductase